MPGKKLVLFDIDGTLLTTNGQGREAFRLAIEETFGHPFDASQISFSGKTDQQILGEILELMEIDGEPGDPTWTTALDVYRSIIHAHLESANVLTLPGVRVLLSELAAHPLVQLGLLTGNLEDTAYLKLRLAALDVHFPFGAFGSDHADRYRLPAIAVDRASQYAGYTFEGEDVVIVGDTEHDVGCAKAFSAFSVAVCTGQFSRRELEQFEPDLLLDDLSNAAQFLQAVVDR